MFAVGALDELAGAALVGLVEANAPAATLGALKVLGNVFDKLASGDFAKFGTLKASAQALQAKLLLLTGGARALTALGFEADDAAGTYMWPDHDASAAASRAAAVRVVLRDLETLHAAIAAVGDSNSPAVATAAVNLMGTYLSNLLAQPTEERRRIGGSNKALHARILSAHGGAALLAASGFVLSPATDTSGQPNAYTCAAPFVSVSLAFSLLARAGDVWAAMADEHAAAGRGGSTGGGGWPALAPEVPSAAVTEFRLEALPDASTIGQAPPPAADMQPALARADGGKRITLHAYQCASNRWSLVGSICLLRPAGAPLPVFVWARRAPQSTIQGPSPPPPAIIIEVDLGDQRLVELAVQVEPGGGVENEYAAAQRFIGEHFEHLNSAQHLEEIATKVRLACAPIIETIASLREAVAAQAG